MSLNGPRFEAYWSEVDGELAELPAAVEYHPLPMRSSEEFTVHEIRLTSIGPYRISGYLSVPAGDGPFPGLLLTPRYGSVNHIPDYTDRQRYVCLQVHHRGQRGSDQPYAASYPGLFTDRITDPLRYVYRGIVADCLRAAEALVAHPAVDPQRVVFSGDDLALITAARRPVAHTVVAENLALYRMTAHREWSGSPQAEELGDWLRNHPADSGVIAETLSLFDPLAHAEKVTAAVILAADEQTLQDFGSLADALSGEVERQVLTHRGGRDRDALDLLLSERTGVEPLSRFRRQID